MESRDFLGPRRARTGKRCISGLQRVCCAKVGHRLQLFFLAAVVRDLAVANDGNIATRRQKLHDFRTLTRHFRPARLGMRILLEASPGLPGEFKIHLSKFPLRRPADGVGLAVNGDDSRAVYEGLPPYRDQDIIAFTGRKLVSHDANDIAASGKAPTVAYRGML